MNCGSDLCVAILFWSILSRPLVILFSSTDKCDYSASLAPSQESGQDWQIPFPHFSDVNFQSDFNTRCSEYVCVCLHVRSSRAEMMMIDQIISKAGELCWDISTATENPIHWTLLNTTPERPRTHEGNFLRQWMTILVKADNRQSNHPWHSSRAVSCCANTHSAALWWVMRQSTNYWTVSRFRSTIFRSTILALIADLKMHKIWPRDCLASKPITLWKCIMHVNLLYVYQWYWHTDVMNWEVVIFAGCFHGQILSEGRAAEMHVA